MSQESPTPERRARLYELAERRVTPENAIPAKDPITAFLESEDEDMIHDIKRLKLKTIEKRYRDELGEEGGRSEEVQQPVDTVEVPTQLIATLSKMSPEEREAAIDTYTRLKMASKMGPESMFLWPAILGTTRANPGAAPATQVDMVEKVINAMRAGKEMAEQAGKAVQTDPMAMMGFAFDRAKEMQPQGGGQASNPLDDAMKMLDYFDQKGMLKKGSEAAPPANDDMVKLEIEKLRTERDIRIKELDLKYGTEQKKLEVEREKANIFGDGITRIAKSAGRAFAEGEEEGEAEQRAAPEKRPSAGMSDQVECPNCKKPVVVPEPEKERDLTCVSCGMALHWTPQAKA